MTQDISSQPHRIALVSGVLHLGGTTTFLCNLGGELVRRGLPVRVLSFERDCPFAPDFARLNVPVVAFDERKLIFEDRLRLILHELSAFRPTAVFANLGSTSFEVLRYLPKSVLRVGTAQSHDPGVYRLLRNYGGNVDLIGAVSRTIQTTLEGMPEFARVPIHYLPYGVPMPDRAVAPGDAPAPLRILYLGRLDQEQKRVRLFPEILEKLKASGIPFHWTIAGEGPERGFLESIMRTAVPEQTISFPGKVAYQEVPAVLAAHELFLLASDYEGLPLSLLEAMGLGLVPVVSDLPSGIREVVDESAGRLVAPDNTDGYAEAIIWLYQHRQELKSLSRNAREKVRREFSVKAMTDRWLKALPPAPPHFEKWARRPSIKPILAAPNPWYFSPAMRLARRLLLKFRH